MANNVFFTIHRNQFTTLFLFLHMYIYLIKLVTCLKIGPLNWVCLGFWKQENIFALVHCHVFLKYKFVGVVDVYSRFLFELQLLYSTMVLSYGCFVFT